MLALNLIMFTIVFCKHLVERLDAESFLFWKVSLQISIPLNSSCDSHLYNFCLINSQKDLQRP